MYLSMTRRTELPRMRTGYENDNKVRDRSRLDREGRITAASEIAHLLRPSLGTRQKLNIGRVVAREYRSGRGPITHQVRRAQAQVGRLLLREQSRI
jgi:hypothetical protein